MDKRTASPSISKSTNVASNSMAQTPQRKKAQRSISVPSGIGKTPLKTPNATRTPSQDRFIPSRSGMDIEISSFNLVKDQGDTPTKRRRAQDTTAAQEEYQNTLSESMFAGKIEGKILKFKGAAPPTQSTANPHKVLYSHLSQRAGQTSLEKSQLRRQIPTLPEKILDGPEIIDDYYLNLLDWSKTNIFTIALNRAVYMLNVDQNSITELTKMPSEEDYICSLSWMEDGRHIAVGNTRCEVQLFDAERQKQLRRLRGHTGRVSSLAWNGPILSSGGRDHQIIHYDVRIADPITSRSIKHEQEVCGLKWNPTGEYLASGGNDNRLCIWEKGHLDQPLHVFTKHTAAVKAIDWCPHQSGLLASGGGTADRNIRFWDVPTGRCIGEQDTKSQVCAIKWSINHRMELVSSHGFSMNQLTVWKYPRMTKLAELTGHTARVLHLAQSPDGETIASAAGDETVRFWKAFQKTTDQKKISSTNLQTNNQDRNQNALRGGSLSTIR